MEKIPIIGISRNLCLYNPGPFSSKMIPTITPTKIALEIPLTIKELHFLVFFFKYCLIFVVDILFQGEYSTHMCIYFTMCRRLSLVKLEK